ncbi:nitrous oxide-stimulated promoter family protein [Dehalogenimonas sp. THU2]|uniref:nitrous oxide-stimulated promoter family protein n=1 Tax=Dehalogenimonas sp. THU2 TaxID=3151121 RepID=UPI0032185F8B
MTDFHSRRRLSREARTIRVMIGMYCRDHHKAPDLCRSCQSLAEYALQRLDKCPFSEGKTVCALCPVHCYKPESRKQIRDVMRYAGPRMMLHHPIMAAMHMFDRRRKKPLASV